VSVLSPRVIEYNYCRGSCDPELVLPSLYTDAAAQLLYVGITIILRWYAEEGTRSANAFYELALLSFFKSASVFLFKFNIILLQNHNISHIKSSTAADRSQFISHDSTVIKGLTWL
jgi:hypothetical protein